MATVRKNTCPCNPGYPLAAEHDGGERGRGVVVDAVFGIRGNVSVTATVHVDRMGGSESAGVEFERAHACACQRCISDALPSHWHQIGHVTKAPA